MHIPLTIIIPAKYEQESIIPVLTSLIKSVKTPHHIIVVNDSDKKDQTATIVQSFIKKHKNIQLIHRINPDSTFGSALTLGLAAANSDAVVPFMADLCDDPNDIDPMYDLIEGGWDVVCASRYMKGGKKIGGPWIQSLFSRVVCTTLRWITGIPTHDVSNAFKMYKTEVMRHAKIQEKSGVEASMDIVLQAYVHGARITEIPTIWTGRKIGHSKFKFRERSGRYVHIYLWALRHLRFQKVSPQPSTRA